MLSDIWNAVASIPNKIQEFATSIGNFFNDLGTNISNWFSNLISDIGKIFSWLGNFFDELLNAFVHAFIPTDEQWDEIEADHQAMGEAVKNHLPFISFFSEELKKAQETVEKTDFLIITIPSFNYTGSGGIGVNTAEQKVVNVGQAYEPYRAYIRGFLFLIVVGLAFVYVIRYILNYGVSGISSGIDTGDGKGGNS